MPSSSFFFFFNDTAPPEIYPLSLPDALPISRRRDRPHRRSTAPRPTRPRIQVRRPAAALRGARPPPFRRARSTKWRRSRSEEHTSELQSRLHLVCRLLLEKKKKTHKQHK